MGLEELECIGQLTKLTRLGISTCWLCVSVLGSSVLAPLTRLVSLELYGAPHVMSLLASLNVEALRNLTIWEVQGDISILERATGLTQLDLSCSVPRLRNRETDAALDVTAMLTGMSRLRSLYLHVSGPLLQTFQLRPILLALTKLTDLTYSGNFTLASDMEACASIPGLKRLEISGRPGMSPACLPALQAMSGLTKLTLSNTDIHPDDLTPEVRAAFNVERFRFGWPGLHIDCNEAC
jgi:hypothetical protein